MSSRKIRVAMTAIALAAASNWVSAVPQLQLGIVGGTYDSTTQTIISSSSTFDLYAFLTPGGDKKNGGGKSLSLTDLLYISAALVPQTGPTGGTLGSITINGTPITVTDDMVYGTPPLDSATTAGGAALPDHGIYETYFYQTAGFDFTGATRYASLNTADDPDLSGLIANTSGLMYGRKFTIDVSGLAAGYKIHFDLYNSELAKCPGQQTCAVDYDAIAFAPFSHDAQSSGGSTSSTSSSGLASSSGDIPEPNSSALALLGLGLVGAGFVMRRKAQQS